MTLIFHLDKLAVSEDAEQNRVEKKLVSVQFLMGILEKHTGILDRSFER